MKKLCSLAIVASLALLLLWPAQASAHTLGGSGYSCYTPPVHVYHPPVYHKPIHKPPVKSKPKPKPVTHKPKPPQCLPITTTIQCYGYIEVITIDERGVHIRIVR